MVKIFLCIALGLAFSGCSRKQENPKQNGVSARGFNEKPSGTITVSACETYRYRGFLEEAARAFEAANPGTTVKVETFTSPDEVDTSAFTADYIRRVNTNLMSGSGADLYAMDVLPLDKMVESGHFENLEPYMTGDPNFHPEDYRLNIFDAVKSQDGTWFLPIDYLFLYYIYDATLVPATLAEAFGLDKAWTTIQLLDLGQSLYNGQNRLFNQNIQGLFEQVFLERYHIYMDKKRANFIGGGFAQMLDAVGAYEKKGYILPRRTGQEADTLPAPIQTARYVFDSVTSNDLIYQFSGDPDWADYGIAGIKAFEGGKIIFNPGKAFAMNSASKNKILAWKFFTFLLSKEMALSGHNSPGILPVHNQARAEKAELIAANSGIPAEQVSVLLSKYRTAVETLSDQINAYLDLDLSSFHLMIEPLAYWLDGSQTSAEVTALIQNKIDLYLSE